MDWRFVMGVLIVVFLAVSFVVFFLLV